MAYAKIFQTKVIKTPNKKTRTKTVGFCSFVANFNQPLFSAERGIMFTGSLDVFIKFTFTKISKS